MIRTRRSFSLVEAVAALVILSVAVPSSMWAIRESTHTAVNPVLISRARWLATERLEDIIADRYAAARGPAWLIIANYPAENTITGSPGFSRSVDFTRTAADLTSPGTTHITATVSVTWSDGRGVQRTLSVATLLTEWPS